MPPVATIAAIAGSLAFLVPAYLWVVGRRWSSAWIVASGTWAAYWVAGSSAVGGFLGLGLAGGTAGVAAALLGGAVGAAYVGWSLRAARRARLLTERVVLALRRGTLHTEWPSLAPELARLARDPAGSADVCYAMLLLASARCRDEAEDLLEHLRAGHVGSDVRVAVCYAAGMLALARGDIAEARVELAGCRRPCSNRAWEDMMSAAEGFLAIAEGDPDRALSIVPSKRAPQADPLWRAVRIHALAARGDEDQARTALVRVASTHPDELYALAESSLPGAPVARRLMAERGAYR